MVATRKNTGPPFENYHIVLFNDEAEAVRGPSSRGHALDPVRVDENHSIIPFSVLCTPGYAKHIPFLETLRYGRIKTDENGVSTLIRGSIRPIERNMTAPAPYRPTGNDWDLPAFPIWGDWSEGKLYESVGRALSQWEKLEERLATLFGALLSPSVFPVIVQRAYGQVPSSFSRAAMIKAAAEPYFMAWPDDEAKVELGRLIGLIEKLSPRRNEIAHGIVKPYSLPGQATLGLALLPAGYMTNRHKIDPEADHLTRLIYPTYAYTSSEILFFSEKFSECYKPVDDLSRRLTLAFEKQSNK